MNAINECAPFLDRAGRRREVRAPAKAGKLARVSPAWWPASFQQSAVSVFSGSAFTAHGSDGEYHDANPVNRRGVNLSPAAGI